VSVCVAYDCSTGLPARLESLDDESAGIDQDLVEIGEVVRLAIEDQQHACAAIVTRTSSVISCPAHPVNGFSAMKT
jgi:hypothetical protein